MIRKHSFLHKVQDWHLTWYHYADDDPDVCLTLGHFRNSPRLEWIVCDDLGIRVVHRDTARLILRGLLMPKLLGEFRGWVEEVQAKLNNLELIEFDCKEEEAYYSGKKIGYLLASENVLAKLDEMESK
jgi:hypothetical protein